MSHPRRAALGRLSLLAAVITLPVTVACSGSVVSEQPLPASDAGHGQADGGKGHDAEKPHKDSAVGNDASSGEDASAGDAACDAPGYLEPFVRVTDSRTGKPICDASATGAGSAESLVPCDHATCGGVCVYRVQGIDSDSPTKITVSAPGYASQELSVSALYCGCDTPGGGACGVGSFTVALMENGKPDAVAPPTPGCPTAAPTGGEVCTTDGLTCEYGSNNNPECNVLWKCQGTSWRDLSTGGICPPPDAMCPSSFATASANLACAQADEQELCDFPEGTCVCSSDPGGLPRSGGPDWSCTPTTHGCPAKPPKLGDPCPVSTPADCDYGQCSGGVGLTCIDGRWAFANVGCPA